MSEAPGKKIVMIAGILFIILGAYTLLNTILSVTSASMQTDEMVGMLTKELAEFNYSEEDSKALLSGTILFIGVILAAIGIFQLVTGIIGVVNCNKPGKSTAYVVLGTIVLAFSVFSLIGGVNWTHIISIGAPIAYFVGSSQNKKSLYQNPNPNQP